MLRWFQEIESYRSILGAPLIAQSDPNRLQTP